MHGIKMITLLFLTCLAWTSCDNEDETPVDVETTKPTDTVVPEAKENFFYGADLSYVNEMIDCGALYKNAADEIKDPYTIFSEAGTNLVRVRLWHNPDWTAYSNFQDVKKTCLLYTSPSPRDHLAHLV